MLMHASVVELCAKASVTCQPVSNRLDKSARRASSPLNLFSRLERFLLIINFGSSHAYYLFKKDNPELKRTRNKESSTMKFQLAVASRSDINGARRSPGECRTRCGQCGEGYRPSYRQT